MTIAAQLQEQAEIAKWINGHLTRRFPVNRRCQLALGCLDLTIEHHAGICVLGTSQLYGPMYALLRVEFEALGRGLWLTHVASDADIDRYEKDKLNVGFGTLLELVEAQLGVSAGLLSTLKSNHWAMFCSFSHTGYQALVRRVNRTHTGPVNYAPREVISALRLAGMFALIAASELSSLSGDQALISDCLERARRYARADASSSGREEA